MVVTLVLILVVMDDALVPMYKNLPQLWQMVLILVVMDDALVHGGVGYRYYKNRRVLILVVMDDALVQIGRQQFM